MPVYHRRLITPQIAGEQYHGPIDGVIPDDHMQTYGYLVNSLRCVFTWHNGPVFEHINNYRRKLCSVCFRLIPDEYEGLYQICTFHCLVHLTRALEEQICHRCGESVAVIRPAQSCLGCIEEYLTVEREVFERRLSVPVIQRWLEVLRFR